VRSLPRFSQTKSSAVCIPQRGDGMAGSGVLAVRTINSGSARQGTGLNPPAFWWHPHRRSEGALMTASVVFLQPVVALIAGILILLVPRLLNYVVALYLIAVGIIGLVQISG
jgi:hypothetical protein